MSERPRIEPSVVSAITSRVASRVAKKLDAEPNVAETWAFAREGDSCLVRTPSDEVVRMPAQGTIASEDDVTCTCLLTPRCFHVLAVVTILPLADAPASAEDVHAAPALAATSDTREGAPSPHDVILEPAQRAAVVALADAASRTIEAGARHAGALLQGTLLRAIHEARALGLHRIAQAGLVVIRGVRELRARSETFDADAHVSAVHALLELAERLDVGGAVALSAVGRARREYLPIGSLDVSGFATVPVVSGTGHAGVVTHVIASDGRFFEVSDVRPGGVTRALGAYDSGIGFGDASLSHRELSRGGLYVQNATSSSDGRLGSGAGVRAVRHRGRGLDDAHIAKRLLEGFDVQRARVARWRASDAMGDSGDAWMFLRATVIGAAPGGRLRVRPTNARDPVLVLEPGSDARELACIEGMNALALDGLALRVVVRADHGSSALVAVAVASDPEAPRERTLTLPETMGGVVMLAFDPISIGWLPPLPRAEVDETPHAPSPVVAIERWVRRLILGGAPSIPEPALVALRRDAAALASRGLVASAAALVALGVAATSRTEPRTLGRALLAAMIVCRRFR